MMLRDAAVLLGRAEELVEKSATTGTVKGYLREWKVFKRFAGVFGMAAMPAEADTLFMYIAWLELQGMGKRAGHHICAVRWFHRKSGVSDNTKNPRVVLALQGIARLGAAEKMDVREPFPLEALRKWERGKRKLRTVREERDPAMVAIGLRCMRRPTELCELKVRHVKEYDRGVKIFLAKSKTDQTMEGKWMHIDEVKGSRTCPVFLLKRYMRSRRGVGGDDPLFVSDNGKKMSVSSVSSMVKNMVKAAGLSVKVSGHSLRIGGATLAVKGGWSMSEICAVGGWKSDAVLRYLRDLGVAERGGSNSMGF
jgi:integrase